MHTRRSTYVGVAAALVGATIAGCGSSKSSTPTTTPTTGAAATSGGASTTGAAPSGTPIIIGNIGSYSGQQASSEAGAAKVIKAWAQSVNDNGGINGHPVQLIVKDLGSNLAGGLAAAKDLIENSHAVAIVGDQDNADTTWAAYVTGKGVPVIGGLPINIPFATSPDFYPSGANIFALIYGQLQLAKAQGTKYGFLYCAESPQCASSVPLVKGLAGVLGVTVAVSAKVAATAPDYTAVCQQLKDSGASTYEVGSGSAIVVRIAHECAAAGVTAKQVTVDGTITPSWLKEPALDGARAAEAVVPFSDTTTEGGQAYQALLAKYIPDLGEANGPNAMYAFVSGKMFEKAAAAVTGDVTAQSLTDALHSLKDETFGGLTAPETFTAGKPTLVNCYFTLGVDGGKFTEPNGTQTTCVPDAVVSGILAQLPKS